MYFREPQRLPVFQNHCDCSYLRQANFLEVHQPMWRAFAGYLLRLTLTRFSHFQKYQS